jgi:outer membrane protein
MIQKSTLLCLLVWSSCCTAQQIRFDRPNTASLGADQQSAPARTVPPKSTPQSSAALPLRLSRQDAEALALKNNPAISVARLKALASWQVVREARSNLWPSAYANLTAVDAHDDSRIAAGGLNNPIIFERAAAGTSVSQLITDFGHTANLVASARLQARAEDQNAAATREQILLAVDQSFYDALQAQAVLKVASQTVASRQLLADQVSALAKSKLKSDLDLSFANVNLAQAKLLQLDAENNAQAAQANLSAILGFPTLQRLQLVEDSEPLSPPPASAEELIAEAFRKRPEILALEFETESVQKQRNAARDELFPTVSALGTIGSVPVGDGRLPGWYGAAGVNVQVPIFNGFLFTSRIREADLRMQAARQRLLELRNRISRDVRTAFLNANSAYQRLAVSAQLLDQANHALELAQTRYNLGLGSIVELSQAQLQQTQAAIGNTQAGYEYRLALSVLRYQTAGL